MNTCPFLRTIKYLTFIIVLFPPFISAQSGEMRLHFISVGHGDAIFIELPEGKSMLVDGGLKSSGRILTEYITRLGYDKIDYMVNTHSHSDHIGGLIEALKIFKVENVWMCPYNEPGEDYREFLALISSAGIEPLLAVRDNKFTIDGVDITILNPPAGKYLRALGGPNGASIVMKLQFGNKSVLLAGDIFQTYENELVDIYDNFLDCDVLKCAHHGSAASGSEKFLTAVSPDIAVVSTGESEYGYPAEETLTRIRNLSISLYRTDINGTIRVITDGETINVEAELK